MPPSLLPVTTSVSVTIPVSAPTLWPYISNPGVPAQFSMELQEASFLDDDTPKVGAVIVGRNKNDAFEWTTMSTVIDCDEPARFSWAVGDVDAPIATWGFEITESDEMTTLTHFVTIHDGDGMVARTVRERPDDADALLAERLQVLVANMRLTVEGIAMICRNDGGA